MEIRPESAPDAVSGDRFSRIIERICSRRLMPTDFFGLSFGLFRYRQLEMMTRHHGTIFHMTRRPSIVLLVLFLVLLAVPLGAQELIRLDPVKFPVPKVLEPNVHFWTLVYSKYDSHYRLLHDERHLGVIYEVIDFSALDESEANEARRRLARRKFVRKLEAKYRDILNNLAAGKVSSTYPEEQERVEKLFANVPGDRAKYLRAIHRMRTQTCLRDRFAEGIERSGRYLDAIEEIFRQRGLPVELSRLPFVESLFQLRAHSSAAAVGIWQFVRPTARFYLDMELEYDERYDPLRASSAAAEYLEDNYERLETWPLAVTAYNHGTNGMRRAVRLLGTRDLGEVVTRYRSRTFGFASRNFYAEFIAAAEVYANREHYFPDVVPEAPMRFETFVAPTYVSVRGLAKQAETPLEELQEMNPALASEVWADHVYLPKDYVLRVPEGRGATFQLAYDELDAAIKSAHQVGMHYRVRSGDSLGSIARRFGTSVNQLRRANGLRNPNMIRIGQRLLIPPGRGGRGATVTTASAIAGTRPSTHVVRKGETLSLIARRYGVSLSSLLAANQLADADRIAVGQRLDIPAAERRTHVVRSGETISSIARLYGTTVQAIKATNRLIGDLIRPSQILVIP